MEEQARLVDSTEITAQHSEDLQAASTEASQDTLSIPTETRSPLESRILEAFDLRNHSEAWGHFEELVQSGYARAAHYNIMLRSCSSSKAVRLLIQKMQSDGISPDADTYRALIKSLMFESKSEEARQVLTEMQAAGVKADAKVYSLLKISPDKVFKVRRTRLNEQLKNRKIDKAWSHFEQIVQTGSATLFEYNSMMLKGCDNSAEGRQLMQRMQSAGISPNNVTYGALISLLMLEGKSVDASQVLEEMQAAGVEPDNKTTRILDLSAESVSKINTNKLGALLQRGEHAKAWSHFEQIVQAGTAGIFQYSVMMKGCDNSAEGRQLMQRMQSAGISPNIVTYGSLISLLMVEGKSMEASQVVEELQAAGLEPGSKIKKKLDLSAKSRSKINTERLGALLQRGETAKAWSLFEQIVQAGMADVFQYSVMVKGCASSAEGRQLMQRMQSAGISPNTVTYAMLMRKLQLEGKSVEASQVLEEMQAAGVEASWETKAILRRTS
eukprot:gene16362-19420_t